MESVFFFAKMYWKQLAIAGVLLFVFLFGYYKGHSNEHANFEQHLQADATALAVAEAENARTVAQQQEIIDRITKEHKDALDKLNDYYKSHPRVISLCPESNQANTLSATSKGSSGADKATDGVAKASPAIELDLLKAGEEILQCQALIQFELEQDRVK